MLNSFTTDTMKMSALTAIKLAVLFITAMGLGTGQASGQVCAPGFPINASDESVRQFLAFIEDSDCHKYSEEIMRKRLEFNWNDWVYYRILERDLRNYFPGLQALRDLFTWTILNESGIDVRLAYGNNSFYLYVRTGDKISGTRKIEIEGKEYCCLNCLPSAASPQVLSTVNLNKAGTPFSFAVTRPPLLSKSSSEYFALGFYDSLVYNKFLAFKIRVNDDFVEMMRSYPNLEFDKLFDTPLSYEAYHSLKSEIGKLISEMDDLTKARFLFDFVRKAIISLDDADQDSFGRDRWLSPEEVLAYPYADSEDKAGLLYCLYKTFLNRPIIVLEYNDQSLEVGVSIERTGTVLNYKNKEYLVSDPIPLYGTFGESRRLQHLPFSVVAEFVPESENDSK